MDIDTLRFQANRVAELGKLITRMQSEIQAHKDALHTIEVVSMKNVLDDKSLKNADSRKNSYELSLIEHEIYQRTKAHLMAAKEQLGVNEANLEFHRMLFMLNLKFIGPSERGVFIPESKLLQTANQF
ncbi:hypothetical protein SPB21_27635 [Leptothoe sp. ISB3NOV94-8A]